MRTLILYKDTALPPEVYKYVRGERKCILNRKKGGTISLGASEGGIREVIVR